MGFLLPWADIVIGSGVMDGYVAQWGLAGPGHPVILLLVAGLFGLTLIVERLPRWARLGLPSIGLACLLIGLAWPYLAGPFDASIGVYVVADRGDGHDRRRPARSHRVASRRAGYIRLGHPGRRR